jgi:multidrug efflux pump subunit AcrA (membrane-fusion protein)
MKRIAHIALPLLGVVFSVYWVALSSRKAVVAAPEKPLAASRYENTIAGAGIIESSSRDISVSPQIGGKVVRVFVGESQFVRRGAPLYQLDDSDLRAQYAAAEADVARARSAVKTSEAQLANAKASVVSALSNQKSLEASMADIEAQAHANEEETVTETV